MKIFALLAVFCLASLNVFATEKALDVVLEKYEELKSIMRQGSCRDCGQKFDGANPAVVPDCDCEMSSLCLKCAEFGFEHVNCRGCRHHLDKCSCPTDVVPEKDSRIKGCDCVDCNCENCQCADGTCRCSKPQLSASIGKQLATEPCACGQPGCDCDDFDKCESCALKGFRGVGCQECRKKTKQCNCEGPGCICSQFCLDCAKGVSNHKLCHTCESVSEKCNCGDASEICPGCTDYSHSVCHRCDNPTAKCECEDPVICAGCVSDNSEMCHSCYKSVKTEQVSLFARNELEKLEDSMAFIDQKKLIIRRRFRTIYLSYEKFVSKKQTRFSRLRTWIFGMSCQDIAQLYDANVEALEQVMTSYKLLYSRLFGDEEFKSDSDFVSGKITALIKDKEFAMKRPSRFWPFSRCNKRFVAKQLKTTDLMHQLKTGEQLSQVVLTREEMFLNKFQERFESVVNAAI